MLLLWEALCLQNALQQAQPAVQEAGFISFAVRSTMSSAGLCNEPQW